MKKAILLLICSSQILVISCDNDDDKKNVTDCTDIGCTENFVTLTVSIKDMSGVAIPLDSFQVVAVENNEDLTRELAASELEMARQSGIYPLFGDEFAERYQNESLTISFRGFIDGDEVVGSEFKVGADCCHVELLAGNSDIVIEK